MPFEGSRCWYAWHLPCWLCIYHVVESPEEPLCIVFIVVIDYQHI